MITKKNQTLNYSVLNHFDVGQFQEKKPFPFTQFSDLLIKEKYEQLRRELPCAQLFTEQKGNYRRYGQASHDRLSLDFSSNLTVKYLEDPDRRIRNRPISKFIYDLLELINFIFNIIGTSPSAASVSPHCDAE